MSGERMTSALLREARKQWWTSPGAEELLDSLVSTLEAYEAEDAARRGMPELKYPWGYLNSEGVFTAQASCDDAVRLARDFHRPAKPCRAVRLAVVEVAEPEPPRPVREVGHSGWVYEVKRRDGVTYLEQHRDASGEPYTEVSCHGSRHEVPPADRALVARLLGEVAP